MRSLIVAAVVAFTFAGSTFAYQTGGHGHTPIVGRRVGNPARVVTGATPVRTTTHCGAGKPCGHGCIAKNKVCKQLPPGYCRDPKTGKLVDCGTLAGFIPHGFDISPGQRP
jgi:hypothetical protein